MAKKNFDSFLNNVGKTPRLSPAEIEEMTKEVHSPAGIRAQEPLKQPRQPVAAPKEQGRRGRKPKPAEPERMIRVSVDLPESVIIELKIKVTREQTDMKNYIRKLVEKQLGMV